MESNSLAMKIHISETTKVCLGKSYHTVERGEVQVKGKGERADAYYPAVADAFSATYLQSDSKPMTKQTRLGQLT